MLEAVSTEALILNIIMRIAKKSNFGAYNAIVLKRENRADSTESIHRDYFIVCLCIFSQRFFFIFLLRFASISNSYTENTAWRLES